jgi:dihydrodipicolinate synthase/N-acetylneuraminate lyase
LATGIALNLSELLEVLSHPNIVAMKDSSNNSLLSQALTTPEFRPQGVALLDGVEYRVAFSASVGYDGVIHGGGALTARRVRSIWECAANGQMGDAFSLDRENSVCLGTIYNRFSSPLQNIVGQKYALKLLGVLDHVGVRVNQRLDAASCERIRQALEENWDWVA